MKVRVATLPSSTSNKTTSNKTTSTAPPPKATTLIGNDTISVLWIELKDLVDWHLIPWNQQRTLNNDRVTELIQIFTSNYKTYQELCIRQPIVVCMLKLNDVSRPYIVDGQHRYWALSSLHRDKVLPDSYKVLVTVIACTSEDQLRFEFNNINNVTPMPKCYLKPVTLLNEAVNKLSLIYGNLKVSDKRINRPNFNIDILKSALIEANFLDTYQITSVDYLVSLFQKLHKHYSKLEVVDFASKIRVSAKDTTLNNIYNKLSINNKMELHFLGMFKPEHTFIWLADLKTLI